ncbi:hypothetical protein C2S51_021348 [Perilla frutescens var. frutescens]|nr:hypothetical protein C2S51_021348 [Perilla frutescens var. frutescens]
MARQGEGGGSKQEPREREDGNRPGGGASTGIERKGWLRDGWQWRKKSRYTY